MRRAIILLLAVTLLTPAAVYGVATVAQRMQGLYFASRSASPLPTAQSPGFYNLNGVLQTCQGSDAGTCYPNSPQTVDSGTSADAGTTLGSGAAAKIDTCETGSNGTKCYRLKDVVTALKSLGELAP